MFVRDAVTAVLPPSTILYLKCKVLLYLLFVVRVCFVSVLRNQVVEQMSVRLQQAPYQTDTCRAKSMCLSEFYL
jgi:hypothetical protein